MRKPSEGSLVLPWLLCWYLGPSFDLSECLNAYEWCLPEGGDLLETFVMFYHLHSTRNKIGQLKGNLKFMRNTEQTVQENMCCSRMCSPGMGVMHWWLMGESLRTLKHPHLRPFFRMPLWCPVLNPLSSAAFTCMILVWGQPPSRSYFCSFSSPTHPALPVSVRYPVSLE